MKLKEFYLPFLVVLLLATVRTTYSQVEQKWTASYNGTLSESDQVTAIATDTEGNVYVAGSSDGANGADYVTIKYNSLGIQQWMKRYNGPGNGEDTPSAVYIDADNNVHITGWSTGDGSGTDFYTIKYDPAGNELWTARYNGTGNDWDEPFDIYADGSGNTYVTGASVGISGYSDIVTIKYNSADRAELWIKRYIPPQDFEGESRELQLDNNGNVIVCGWTHLNTDTTGQSFDFVTIKYDPSGNEQWAVSYDGPAGGCDRAYALDVDGSGNVYVAGTSEDLATSLDYATVKYNAEGNQQWVNRYNGPGNDLDIAFGLEIDPAGGIIVSGQSTGIGTSWDYATVKYNESGTQLYESRYDGPSGGEDEFYAMTIDGQGGVYVTGSSWSGTDWTSTDFATIKYSSSGEEEWVARYNSPDTLWDEAYALFVDRQNYIYVAGTSYTDTIAGENYFIIKYSQPGSGIENLNSNSSVYCRNFPNPFYKTTTIEFRLPASSRVTLTVHDIFGRELAVLANEEKQKGTYLVIFDPKGLEAGIYFYRFQAESYQEIHKFIFIPGN